MIRASTLSEALALAGMVERRHAATGGKRSQPSSLPSMPVRYSGANEQMRNALARVAPGTPLRDGIDRVVRAKAGALLVLVGRARRAGDLLGRLPRRRAVQPATAVGAGEDGRRDHHLDRRRSHRQGQRPPRPRSDRAHHRDGHPPSHRRARRPVARRAGHQRQRGDGRRSTSTPAARSTSCRRSVACSTVPTRRCRRSSATRCASTTRSPTSRRSRSKTS